MRKILLSFMLIGVFSMMLGAETLSNINDIEISTNNSFSCGYLDLTISVDDYQYRNKISKANIVCEKHITWRGFNEKILYFNLDDLKPGDYGKTIICIKVFDNPAWLWIYFFNVHNDDNDLIGLEGEIDFSGGPDEGELAGCIETTLWMDEGYLLGWQGAADPYEADNIFQSEYEEIIFKGSMEQLYALSNSSAFLGPFKIDSNKKVFIGMYWKLPDDVGDIINSDSLKFNVEFYIDQFENNPGIIRAHRVHLKKLEG